MKTCNLFPLAFIAAVAHAQSGAWGQCGGIGWTGATSCVSGYVCTYSNNWYSQCIPGTAPTTTPSSSTMLTTKTHPSTTSSATTSSTTSSPTGGGIGWKWLGVDESGAEFGSGSIPGVWGTDFTFPADSSLSVSQYSRNISHV